MTKDNIPELDLREEFPPHTWEEWLAAVQETLKGADYDKTMKTKTYEGLPLNQSTGEKILLP